MQAGENLNEYLNKSAGQYIKLQMQDKFLEKQHTFLRNKYLFSDFSTIETLFLKYSLKAAPQGSNYQKKKKKYRTAKTKCVEFNSWVTFGFLIKC